MIWYINTIRSTAQKGLLAFVVPGARGSHGKGILSSGSLCRCHLQQCQRRIFGRAGHYSGSFEKGKIKVIFPLICSMRVWICRKLTWYFSCAPRNPRWYADHDGKEFTAFSIKFPGCPGHYPGKYTSSKWVRNFFEMILWKIIHIIQITVQPVKAYNSEPCGANPRQWRIHGKGIWHIRNEDALAYE